MYNLPHLYDVLDYLHDTDLEKLQEFCSVVDCAPFAGHSTEFPEFTAYLMEKDGLEPPSNPTKALNLYTHLLQKIEDYNDLNSYRILSIKPIKLFFITSFRQYLFK